MRRDQRVSREESARPNLDDEENGLALPEAPDGYVYRWVRTHVRNELDYKNVNLRFDRQGWEPVKPEEVPAAFRISQMQGGRFDGCVQNGDLILAKNTVDYLEAQKLRKRNRTAQQTEGIRNQLMNASDSRMPIYDESRANTSFGRRQPALDD